ncbi:MAG: sulfotransferase domain-containing protein [Bacteroidota bacterium]
MAKIKKFIRRGLKKILPGNFPNFIIIGAQKSGTTSLHYYLNQHPDLVGSTPKELHYFDRLVNYGYDLDWYKSQFYRRSIKEKKYFETTPSYIYHESVAKQIYDIDPEIKLILILREPTSRAYSAWNMYREIYENNQVHLIKKERRPGQENWIYKCLYGGRDSFPSFLEAVKIEQKLINNELSDEPAIIRRGMYAEQIKSYLRYFDLHQMLILGFKDFTNKTDLTLSRVYNFLGVRYVGFCKFNKIVKNSRRYNRKISTSEKEYVDKIYENANKELFDLIDFKINW